MPYCYSHFDEGKTLVTRNNLEMYDAEASQWWAPEGIFKPLRYFNEPRFNYFNQFVDNWQDKQVLDVGCGGGYTCEFLAQQGAEVFGVDRSEQSIAAAQAHALDQNLNIQYKQAVGESLPFDDSTFDAVVCVDVLEHVSDLGQVIREIFRVLKPDGYFLFDTINKTFKSRLVMIWFLEYIAKEIPKGTHDWQMFIPPQQLEEHLQSAGFKQLDMRGFDIKGKDKQTGAFNIKINDNLSVIYIGKAVKL